MTEDYKHNWENNLKVNFSILQMMGLWPPQKSYVRGSYMIFTTIVVFSCVVWHIITQVINIYFVRNDLRAVVGIIYVVLIEIMGGIKTFFLIKNMKLVKGRIDMLSNNWFQPKNGEQMLLIQPSIHLWKTVYRLNLYITFGGNALYALFPFMDKETRGKRFPLIAWYPYDALKSPYFEITFVFQVCSTLYLSLVHANVDALISGFNVYIGCQFDILSHNLRNFAKIGTNVGENFIKCVVHHKQILSFLDGCTRFFNWIMIWHLIISGVAIGITMFQLTLLESNSSEFHSLLVYGFWIFIQIFMYCWFGNELTVKSNLVSYAVFESDWINLPKDIKKNLIFFTMKVLPPVKLSALNIFELSLTTFMSILKTAWSYFALLSQLSTRK